MLDRPKIERLNPRQEMEIKKALILKGRAERLRNHVSMGRYGKQELEEFWSIAFDAPLILKLSGARLGVLAGIGEGFFSSVVRQRRSPRLENFLAALTAIIEVSDERLLNVRDLYSENSTAELSESVSSTVDYIQNVYFLSVSLRSIADEELARLKSLRPNSDDAQATIEKQIDIIQLLSSGFASIMQSISADKPLHDERPALKLAASEFSQKIGEWWEKNAADITDIGVRMPVIVSSVALLKLAGAEMSFATPAVFALVGGPKIVEIFKRKRK